MSVLMTLLLAASAFDESFDLATEAYRAGDYAVAATSLEQLVEQGVVEPEVFFNLGNAYYRQGLLAPAIANFERALQLEPGMIEAQENLNACVRQTTRRLSKPHPPEWEQSLLFWHYDLRRVTSLRLALVCWVFFWGLLALRQFRRFPYTRRAAAVAVLGAVMFGVSWWAKSTPTPLAVAAENGIPVQYGVGANEMVHFELFEGDRVAVDRREDGWARVETGTGERGWTREEYLVFVGPPYARQRSSVPGQAAALDTLGNFDTEGEEDAPMDQATLPSLGYID